MQWSTIDPIIAPISVGLANNPTFNIEESFKKIELD